MAFNLLPIPKTSPDIGECIYCGTRTQKLSREHAIPYGLNGPWTLLHASCDKCADVTKLFEQGTQRELLLAFRTVLRLQTYRPRERPKVLPLVLESAGGVQRTVDVSPNEYPLYLPTPLMPPPGVVLGREPAPGVQVTLQFIHIAGPTVHEVAQRYKDVEFVGARLSFLPEDFARTLAKIGYCAAVYTLGIAPFRNSPIRRVILGEDQNIGHWVGSWNREEINEAKGFHQMRVLASGTDVHVILRLFAQFGAPEYHIALGPADPDFASSDAWPWK